MLFTRKLTFAIIFSCVLFCCNARRTPTPPADLSRYDLLHPNIMNLPEGLAEISGITYYAKDSSLFAIQDEGGILYKIPINKRDSIQKWIYDKKHDFEDVTLVDSVFYVLISNGDIESVDLEQGIVSSPTPLSFRKRTRNTMNLNPSIMIPTSIS